MVTTTKLEGATLPYPEDDKLGPLGAKVSALYHPGDLRTSLVREFSEAVQRAKAAASSVDEGPSAAVHDTRKAMRRARAVLEMIAGALPKSERKAVRRAIQEARRALSTARDHAVAPETLGGLALDEQNRATAKRVLENAADALPAIAELKQLVGESAARAAAQLEAISAALPAEVSWDVVVQGIAGIYGEARSARRAGKRSKPSFHSWRRRSKELVYQLELLANHAGPRMAAIHAEIAGVTETLGPAVDLIMLREFVTTYAQGIPSEDLEHLEAELDTQIDELMKHARKAGRDSFSQKPKRFAKRLAKAVRRDLTPSDEAEASGQRADD